MDSSVLSKEKNGFTDEGIDEIKREIKELSYSVDRLEKENDNLAGIASTIISWSGIIFTIFSVILIIVSIYTGVQITKIREIKKDLESLYSKAEKEIVRHSQEIKELKDKFEIEKKKSLSILFPLIEGQWYFYHGNYDKALKAFQKAKEIEPTHPKIIRNLYRILAQMGRVEEAISELERLNKEYPTNKMIKYRLAQAYRRNNQLDVAEEIIKNLALEGKFDRALYEYGTILLFLKKYKQAEQCLKEANRQLLISESNTKHWVYINLAIAQIASGNVEKGLINAAIMIDKVENMLKKTPRHPHLLLNLGFAQLLVDGKNGDGFSNIEKAIDNHLPVEFAKSMKIKVQILKEVNFVMKHGKKVVNILESYIKENRE